MRGPRRHVLNRPLVYQFGVAVVGRLPRRFNHFWVRAIADLNFLWLRQWRASVCRNLAPVVGSDPRVVRRTARRLFRNYAEMLIDYATYFGGKGPPVEGLFARAEGYQHLEAALAGGKGVLLITAHLGFWELGGLFFRQRGLPVHVLTLRDPDPGVHDERARARDRLGIRTITVGVDPWSSLGVVRALRENAIVGLAVDRYRGPGAVPVSLFGHRVLFAPAPAIYARLTGAAVVPAFVLADGKGGYRGWIMPPLEMPITANREQDALEGTRRIAAAVTEAIRAYPDQWYNFDPIWEDH